MYLSFHIWLSTICIDDENGEMLQNNGPDDPMAIKMLSRCLPGAAVDKRRDLDICIGLAALVFVFMHCIVADTEKLFRHYSKRQYFALRARE